MIRKIQCCQCLLSLLLYVFNLCSCSCPEACDPCIAGHLVCMNTGLSEIPKSTDLDLTKVTIQKQRFTSSDLSGANFTTFLGILQLSIRTSNINKVMPFTFSNMTSLRLLDLSDNAELIIKHDAFSRLQLQILKLDNMGMITLDLDAFQGLSVLTLSIQNSNLLSLPLQLIQPLSKGLLKLFLKNNHLRTLDPRLKNIFQSIEVLELQKNPFVCNCSILWLAKILQLSSFVKPKANEFESPDELYPSCVSPAELRKKSLHTIANKLTKCTPPDIIRIDISFDSYSSATIDCFTNNRKDVHHQTFVGWLPPNEAVSDNKQLRPSVKVLRQSTQQRYLCRATNANGNSELAFQIDWHNLPRNGSRRINTTTEQKNETQELQNLMWRSVFSLFEMICAIVGTLITTMLIFIAFFCFHRCRLHFPYLEERRKFNYETPPQYERAIYSDARRFCETDIDGNLFPPPPPTPPRFLTNRMML